MVLVGFFVGVFVRIIYIQLFDANHWLPYAEKQISHNHSIEQQRGNIYDIKGRLLVASIPQYDLYIDTRVPALHEKEGKLWNENIDSFCIGLSNILGTHSAKEYKRRLTEEYKRGNGRYRIYPV
ncbi:MAG: hypothetical protein II502_01410, partial [Paludibacteraceae bacterium]|nr:hypothetical protein [Paludibacteraceae bacterium]